VFILSSLHLFSSSPLLYFSTSPVIPAADQLSFIQTSRSAAADIRGRLRTPLIGFDRRLLAFIGFHSLCLALIGSDSR
jgi:hypothetical protein